MSHQNNHWSEYNQRYLLDALAKIKSVLRVQFESDVEAAENDECEHLAKKDPPISKETSGVEFEHENETWNRPPNIETLTQLFGLSAFERAVVLICAGVELDASIASLLGIANGDPRLKYPTFSLALATLPEPHWDALAPTSPLRMRRLIVVEPGASLTTSPLRIEERVLNYLTGVEHLDEALLGIVQSVSTPEFVAKSHLQIAQKIVDSWSRTSSTEPPSIVQLCGPDRKSQQAVAAVACSQFGVSLFAMPAQLVPSEPHDLENLIRLWQRESGLCGGALLIDCHDTESLDAARHWAISRMIENSFGAVVVVSRERRALPTRNSFAMEVGSPTMDEQRGLWRSVLGEHASHLNGQVEGLIAQFQLPTQSIQAVGREAFDFLENDLEAVEENLCSQDSTAQESSATDLGKVLWAACRDQARPRLDELAQRINPNATIEDLVLPELQQDTCREIAVHVRQRMKVYDEWGFGSKSSRGLGISALFAGPSGTGKTMAAEVLANELELDLYCIDLSQVVSKYIGETEKNLRSVFDAAEVGGAILLFDEADALFGKRSEVKDSHDRHANVEVSYLLQRMECYRGLAILTTNMKSALDSAFLRRIRFVVQFPFPDAQHRRQIWSGIFPNQTPCEQLDFDKLSRLNVTGGNIRNVALNAAFMAADRNESVSMSDLLHAAKLEYAKLEKPLTEAEIGGWV